jgi:regulator of extracellular matrix RemA (YlzA/DUF370 family)
LSDIRVELVHVGFGSFIALNRVTSILTPESAPIKRLIQEARERNALVDATYGRRTKAVIVQDNGHIVLAAILPETIAARVGQGRSERRGSEDAAQPD